MNTTLHSESRIRADAEITRLLEEVSPDTLDGTSASTARADELLARVVWSRLSEPGDAVAGALIAGLGIVTALDLVASGSSAKSILATANRTQISDGDLVGVGELPSPSQLAASLQRWRPRLDRKATLDDLRAAASAQAQLVTPEESVWPASLADLGNHAPHALWVRGNREALNSSGLAVVGARACTSYGGQVTAELTAVACEAGLTIVSGAAYGVDAVAHRTALACGGSTVAVVAGGVDRPYPAAHDSLLARIASEGAVCSEMVPGSAPTRWRFLMRNRLIAALSGAVLVTEAGMRSGTLNTAGHGAELGRALGAVPGPITSAASAGCHRLIREYGAALITSGDEVLELCGVSASPTLFELAPTGDGGDARPPSGHLRILDALPLRGGRVLGDVARLAGMSVSEAAGTLAELQLLGFVSQQETPSSGEATWVLVRRE